MNLSSGIYCIRCINTGKVYVGQTIHLDRRWKEHCQLLTQRKHRSRYLQHAWNKHGADGFVFEILEYVESDRLTEREQFHTDRLRAANPQYGFNTRPCVDSNKGISWSDEVRAKMSESLKGRTHSAETRAKISSAHKGKVFTRETVAKMSASRKGNRNALGAVRSPETRAKLSAAKKGKKMTDERKAEWLKTLKPMTPEIRAKISAAQTGKSHSPESRAKISASRIGNQYAKGHVQSAEHRAKIAAALTRHYERKRSECY